MKKLLFAFPLMVVGFFAQAQTVPVYLDEAKPMEQRIEDALARMTLEEKVRVVHAQSKFSSAGVPVWDFPIFGLMTALMAFVPMYCGMSGNRRGRQTIPV